MPDYSKAVCKIFPPLGIARFGDSPDDWFFGPEVPGSVPEIDSYKDKMGRIKRQGARFRVFAFFLDGVVEELQHGQGSVKSIEWSVQLANKKAAWHEFAGADRVADLLGGKKAPLRNPKVKGADREGLVVAPPPASISGANARPKPIEGEFTYPGHDAQPVKLGDLRTDSEGNLVVLGGHGKSDTVFQDNPLYHYANNNGWFDDGSDGPVDAKVQLKDGKILKVEGAWVVAAPPHYSPHTPNVVTLYDAMAEAAVKHKLGWEEGELGPAYDGKTSFTRHIYPLLVRLARLPWVSARSHRGHAAGKRGSFLDPEVLAVLSDPAQAGPGSMHDRFLARLRTPIVRPLYDASPFKVAIKPESQQAINEATLYFMPALAGDEGDVEHGNPKTWFALTEMQYFHLRQWAQGNFKGDWPGVPPPAAKSFESLDVKQKPRALTEAALEMGQGGAFYPGIELTSIIRSAGFYSGDAFRVSRKHEAGDLTKWMALPWQADFFECVGHWWPTIRPDDVVPGHVFDEIKEDEATRGDLRPLLIAREPWTRGLDLEIPGRPGIPGPRPDELAGDYAARAQAWLERATGTALRRYLPAPMEHELPQVYKRRLEEFLAHAFQQSPDIIDVPTTDIENQALLTGAQAAVEERSGEAPELPEPTSGETRAAYRAKLLEHLVNELKLPADILDGVDARPSNSHYRALVLRLLGRLFEGSVTLPPPPDPAAPAAQYYRDHEKGWRKDTILQGFLDLEWRRRNLNRGKNDMQRQWSRLGFVRAADHPDGEVLVERDRKRFDLLSFREIFHHLMNIEANPDFLARAKEIGAIYFRLAREFDEEVIPTDPELQSYRFFSYDSASFTARMEEIYEAEKRSGEAYDPVDPTGFERIFNTPARVIERIRQLAPFNQLDGSWLERIAKAGPIDDVQSALFEIWSDEIGAGDPAKNHANIYTDLMHEAGIYLPPLNSRAYAFHPDLWEGSFSSAAYQSSAALFPETFYPELLGMTLYLEWEAVYLPAMVKLYDYYGYSSLFYRLHVAIDNPVNGHGARARDAVVRYLNDIRARGGETEMQEHWRRIWDGYLAFKFIGAGEWDYRFANPPTIDERMVAMVVTKRQYGQLNHGARRFAGNLINDWFDEPSQFLAALAESDLIVRGRPGRSPFFEVTGQTGPMLKVFTEKELDLWAEWIASLPPDPVSGQDSASEMLVVLRELAARGESTAGHEHFMLDGSFRDPEQGGKLTKLGAPKPVSWWFAIDQPDCFLAALADPANRLVVKGKPERSRLVNDFLRPQRPMARFLSRAVPELGEVSAREVIVRWIKDECPLPKPTRPGALKARAELLAGRMPGRAMIEVEDYDAEVVRLTLASTPARTRPTFSRLRSSGPGGGAVH